MNDQQLFLRVGELAAAVGCPMPAITRVDLSPRTVPAQVSDGMVGPDLKLRSDAEKWCVEALDVVIAQALLAYRLGVPRHHRWFRRATFVVGAALMLAGLSVWPIYVAWPVAVCGGILLHVAASAVYSRWLMRRLDLLMLPVLGAAAMAEGIRHLSFPMKPGTLARWLWSGAGPLASERLRWLQAAAPGISSAAD
ncbi:hypothetical protein [Kribbella sp. NPDC004536]|uniref:hypothetical protein n=1 Tax=Kribbella sp. NPDC004536 TaxID=3364106 RepID=UPI003673A361